MTFIDDMLRRNA